MPNLSIIVPVYNVEKYLSHCIKSILSQTYTDFELILINDGSSDCSCEICDKYALSDSRVIVIHQKNSGVSRARNTGIEIARGSYISFVDADDWIEDNMYEFLLKNQKISQADIVICGFCAEYVGERGYSSVKKDKFIFDSELAIKTILENRIFKGFSWGKLYKKELIEKQKFPVGIRMCEDLYFNVKAMLHASKIIYYSEQKYHYRQRKNSAVQNIYIQDYIDVFKKIQSVLINNSQLNALACIAYLRGLIEMISLIFQMEKTNQQSYLELRKQILSLLSFKFYFSTKISFKIKFVSIMLFFPFKINIAIFRLKKYFEKLIFERNKILFD